MRVCGEPQNDVAVALAPAAHPAVVNWEMRWLSPTEVSTPSLISLCCNSMNSAGLFTATIACIAAVKVPAILCRQFLYALVNSLSGRSTRQPALNRLSMSSFGYGRALVFTPFETTC
jgi:hypothetical protein